MNSAVRVARFAIRQDIAEKFGFSAITDYDTPERYFYAVKEKGGGVIRFAASSNTNFNAAAWDDPHTTSLAFTGKGLL